MRKLRVGIIGLGRIASLYEKDRKARSYYAALTHAGAYDKHPRTKIVCGADIDKKRLAQFGRMWGVKRLYTDYNEMLDKENVDILSICTHSDLHRRIMEKASKFVKVILCEKPFTASSGEIRQVLRLQKRRGLKITINTYRQYDPSHSRIRSLIRTGRLGKVQRVNCYYGKGLRNTGSHLLCYLLSIFGAPEKVKVLGKKRCRGTEEFTYDVYMKFKKGIPALIQACDFNNYRLFEMDFICEKGRVQILDEGLSIKVYGVGPNKVQTGARQLLEKKDFIRSTIGRAIYFAVDNAVKMKLDKNTRAVMPPKDYLDVQLLIEKIKKEGRSLKNG